MKYRRVFGITAKLPMRWSSVTMINTFGRPPVVLGGEECVQEAAATVATQRITPIAVTRKEVLNRPSRARE
jgi:hypothetical protein